MGRWGGLHGWHSAWACRLCVCRKPGAGSPEAQTLASGHSLSVAGELSCHWGQVALSRKEPWNLEGDPDVRLRLGTVGPTMRAGKNVVPGGCSGAGGWQAVTKATSQASGQVGPQWLFRGTLMTQQPCDAVEEA